jgi:hypothetical protein
MNDNSDNMRKQAVGKPGFPPSVRLAGVIWVMVGGFLLIAASTMLRQKLYFSSAANSTDKLIVPKLAIGCVLMAGLISVGIATAMGKNLPIARIGALSIISGCFGVCSSLAIYTIVVDAGFSDYPLWKINILNAGLIVAGILAINSRRQCRKSRLI